MAVANYQEVGGLTIGPRNFHPPKRADLKYWYKEANKALGWKLPTWEERFRNMAEITEDTIVYELPGHGTLWVARKKHMR